MKPYYSLSDFPDRKNAGKNFIVRCPKCGTMHLYISKAKGLYHCFYAGCDFNGILTDYCKDNRPMFSYRKGDSPSNGATYRPQDNRHTENAVNEVPMLPGDYKVLAPTVLQKIKPLDESPDCTDPDQLAARRYLADQGISLATAIAAHIGCLRHYCITKDSEDKREQASTVFPCIAYVNYVDGRPVNAKYRSCSPIQSPSPEEGQPIAYSKFWSQDSPTTPCAPYNIDCINPLLVEEEIIPRLIIVEGGKDALILMEAGYRHVISVPSGAATDLAKCFEAFIPWLDQVQDIVICGDSDLPGRTLVKRLSDYFGARCLFTILPGGCKDIGDVMKLYGTEVVRTVIDDACACQTTDIITVEQRRKEVIDVLHGKYDHGYSVGYGPLTDRIFHPTDTGGLIIMTGMPNSGKTDFLNDLTSRIMRDTERFVCYLSFEVPDKDKHIAHLVHLLLGKANTTDYTDEQLTPYIDFLNTHMIHLDMHEVPPTPGNILHRADLVRRRQPLKYLVIDPYLFVEAQNGKAETETQSIKSMLTRFQSWGREHHIWVIIVAHPRSLKKIDGKNEMEDINMYTISGSANWANLADFILSITRVNEPNRAFTRLDVLKVRDQELCRTGTVYYTRQPCGRYEEHESEEECSNG
ncbi:toprim domain-containing protein [uncultured Phocaeicola sp.]|uniref:bifunctional DNA primase/helicase n=2 Tax=uncultured Phocaeicola sp. TaxID=990718 RepID=UPI00258AB22E|nr:toprim domain-containing protein [uncultured Phocaeicola sp.]